MSPLPKRPERSAPIPNNPFESPEVTSIKGPYWYMELGEGLELDPDGNIIAPDGTGDTISDQATINSSYFSAGIGKGLGVVGGSEFSRMDLPPYNCRTTDLYTAGVSNFGDAWQNCTSLTSFPLLDVSSGTFFGYSWKDCTSLTSFPLLDVSNGTNFNSAWFNCESLTTFPLLDVSNGTDFSGAWSGCESLTTFPLLDVSNGTNFALAWGGCESLTTFPLLDVSNGTNFSYAWSYCTGLTSFPLLDVSSGTNFFNAWQNCTSLTTFPAAMFNTCTATNFTNAWQNCALNQTSVNNILVSLNTAGQLNGTVNLNGGTSAAPSGAGATAKSALQAKGWTVTTN